MNRVESPDLAIEQGRSWLALATLGYAALAAVIWFLWEPVRDRPVLGLLPLGIALLPWAVLGASRRIAMRRTGFELPLAVFLLAAGTGVWAAYDRPEAWGKFFMILAGVLLFYALALQPAENVWAVVGILAAFGAFLSLFLLVPHFILPALDTDTIAGMVASLTPFAAAMAVRKRGFWVPALLATLLGLLLSGERGPVVGVLFAALVVAWWLLSGRLASRRGGQAALFGGGLLVAGLLALAFLALARGSVITSAFLAIDRLPGHAVATSRLELWRNTLKLLEDYPLTGGGLSSFPGQYSQYMLVVPFAFLEHSHNLFLEAAFELGWVGLAALLALLATSAVRLVLAAGSSQWRKVEQASLLQAAGLASLAATGAHGLLDTTLFSRIDVALLFLTPGIACALAPLPTPESGAARNRQPAALAVGALFVVLLLASAFSRPIQAKIAANFCSLKMARVQLAGFPTGKWDEGQSLDALGAVQPCFDRVLQNDPDNRAANYRLGLIALLQRNFPVAAERLAKAHAASPGHRGITKNLAYSLVWAGDYQRAMALLRRLPEAQNEMDAYTRWWHEQGRDDLARAAYHVLFLLRQGPSGQPESVYGLD